MDPKVERGTHETGDALRSRGAGIGAAVILHDYLSSGNGYKVRLLLTRSSGTMRWVSWKAT
jgi:hypothetical protein